MDTSTPMPGRLSPQHKDDPVEDDAPDHPVHDIDGPVPVRSSQEDPPVGTWMKPRPAEAATSAGEFVHISAFANRTSIQAVGAPMDPSFYSEYNALWDTFTCELRSAITTHLGLEDENDISIGGTAQIFLSQAITSLVDGYDNNIYMINALLDNVDDRTGDQLNEDQLQPLPKDSLEIVSRAFQFRHSIHASGDRVSISDITKGITHRPLESTVECSDKFATIIGGIFALFAEHIGQFNHNVVGASEIHNEKEARQYSKRFSMAMIKARSSILRIAFHLIREERIVNEL